MYPIHTIVATLVSIIFIFIEHQSVLIHADNTLDDQVPRKLWNIDLSGPTIPLTHTHNAIGQSFFAGPWKVGIDFEGILLFDGCDICPRTYNADSYTVRLKICYKIYKGNDGFYMKDIYFYTLIDALPVGGSTYTVKTDVTNVSSFKSASSTLMWTIPTFMIEYTIYATETLIMKGIMFISGDGSWTNNINTFLNGSPSTDSTPAKLNVDDLDEILPRGRWVRINQGRSQISMEYSVGYSVEQGHEDSINNINTYAQTTGQSTSHEFSSKVYGEVTASASFFGVGVSATVGFSATYTDGTEQMVEYSSETSSEIGKSAFSSVTHQYSETVQVGCGDELGYNLFIYEVEAPKQFKVIPKPIIAWCKKGSMPPVCPPSKCMDEECTYCRSNTFKDPDFDKIMSNSTMGQRLQALDPDAPTITKSPTSTNPNNLVYIGLGVGIPCAILLSFVVTIVILKRRRNRNITNTLQDKAQKESLIESRNPSSLTNTNTVSFISISNVTQPQSNNNA